MILAHSYLKGNGAIVVRVFVARADQNSFAEKCVDQPTPLTNI